MVKPERLFIDVAEQVERLDADVGAFQRTLKQAPEVLQPVRVNLPTDVLNRVVNDGVLIVCQPLIGP